MTLYSAGSIYTEGQLLKDHYFEEQNGVITTVAPLNKLAPEEFKNVVAFKDAMIVPGFINTHNHSFQSLLKGFCDDCDFFTWRDQALYKYAPILSTEDIYNGALFAFGEMLKQGITTVCDFFYINDQQNKNANAVIQAAKDLGIRIVLARTLYDWDGAPVRFRESIDEAVNNTRALFDQHLEDPLVEVIPAPHSLHGASVDLIRAGAQLAEELGQVFHMHIAEGQYERQMMIEKHGLPPIQYLDSLGILSHRLVGIHCVWLDEDEIRLMAERKTGLAYNPSSNMFLGDGVTRIKEMHEAGISISLGTDGGCSNNRASIIEEMRMTSLLQKVVHCDSTVTTAEQVFAMGTSNGGKNLDMPVGQIKEGQFADFAVIDLNDLSMQPVQNALKNIVYSMQPSAIQHVYVAGKPVYQQGQILTVPEDRIVERVRQTTANWR